MEQEDGPCGVVGGGSVPGSTGVGEAAAEVVTSFLSDTVLSWTIDDIKNGSPEIDKVTSIPPLFSSSQQYQDIHSQLLVEETRAILRSALVNVAKSQIFHLHSVQECGLSSYYVDINLEEAVSDEAQCHHVAKDNDIFLLSYESPLNPDFNKSSSCLGMTIKVGCDIFYQKAFTVLLSKKDITEIEPEKLKFATFLSNLMVKMKISKIISLKNNPAITTILDMQKTINKMCNRCDKVRKCKTELETFNSIVSSVSCEHGSQTQIVCTPPGTAKHRVITEVVKSLVGRKLRVLVCFPSETQISEFLTQIDDYSDVLILNNLHSSQKQKKLHNLSLDHKSQELFCCLTLWKIWMKDMACLLGLDAYHRLRCQLPVECEECKLTGIFDFSLASFTERFNYIAVSLRGSMKYIIEQLPKVFLPVCDLEKARDLLQTIDRFEDLIRSDGLTDNMVQRAFDLVAGSDFTAENGDCTLGEELNKTRLKCISSIQTLKSSLVLPQLGSRHEMQKFCIAHSLVIISTPDCASQLCGVKMDPFHAFIVGDAGLINENELLMPLLLPRRHTVLLGDHKHLQPLVESKVCKAAGYGSLFHRMQPLSSKKHMLREQHKMEKSISLYPSQCFYEGEIFTGPKIDDSTYSGDLRFMLKLAHYSFQNIRAVDKHRLKGKITVQTAAVMILIEKLYKVLVDIRLQVAVICLSRNEAGIVRRQLRSNDEMHANVNIVVKHIDELQPEWFDVVILSTIVDDYSKVDCIKDNNINVALTCASRFCWIIGESKNLLAGPLIWRNLVRDAQKRDCLHNYNGIELYEIAQRLEAKNKILESKNKIDSTNSNSSIPNNVVFKTGQETTWSQRPHRGKFILAHVRDQRNQPDTCFLQSCAGSTESCKKYKCACLNPPEDFRCILSIEDYKSQYVSKLKLLKGFGSEDMNKRGEVRLKTSVDILKDPGVLCSDISDTEVTMSPTEHHYSGQRLKISAYKIIETKGMDATKLTAVLKRGNIMPSSFRISRNYFYLRPGEVYSYDEKLPYIHSKTDLRASHAVMTIGTGHEDDQTEVGNEDAQVETQETKKLRHIVMQNSEGNLFGVDGKGRVDQNSIRQLYLLKV